MDYLQQLLNNQPVEWKKLGEVAENMDYLRKPITSGNRVAGDYPYYGASGIVDYIDNYIFDGDFLLVSEDGANLVARKTPIAFSISGKNWVNNHAHVLKFNTYIERKFVEYYLNNLDISEYVSGAAQPKLNQNNLNRIPIPIPPLSVQSRIVEILDKFTAMEAELQAELELRKKQYIYYRELLLLKNPLCKPVPLGWLGEVRMCKRILKNQTTEEGDIPFYKIGTFGKQADAYISRPLYEEFRSKYPYPSKGDMLISASGTIGRVIEFDGEDAYFQDSNIVWLEHDGTRVINRYLYHCYQIADWKVAKGGTITRLYNDNFKKTEIPIPPLSEQARIVEMLDKFDALINSISEGLPLEIQLRRQQYEYYREQLLDFRR